MKLLLALDSRVSNQAGIGVLDPHEGRWSRFQVIEIMEPFKRRGFRGSALAGRQLYAVSAAALYEFELDDGAGIPLAIPRRTIRRPEWELGERAAADLHDVHFSPSRNCLLIANSCMDSIDEISVSGELRKRHYLWDICEAVANIAFDRQPGVADLTHVNHISERNGRVYLTLGNWNGTRAGKVIRLDDGEIVLDGLEFPHDGFFHGDYFYVSQSGTSEILIYNCTEHGEVSDEPPAVLPVSVRRDAWLGSFQWVRGIAVTDRYIIAGVTQWRKGAADRPQLPPRLVFFDRHTREFEGELFLPAIGEFPVPCIFTIHVLPDERGEDLEFCRWESPLPEPGPAAQPEGEEGRGRIAASCLHFHSAADRSKLSPTWSLPPGPRRNVRVVPDAGLWVSANLETDERFYVSTHPGPFSEPPATPLPLELQAGLQYEVSVLYTPVRGELSLQAWVIQYGKRQRLGHDARALKPGANLVGFEVHPRCQSLCFAFRVAGRGVGHLTPLSLFLAGRSARRLSR